MFINHHGKSILMRLLGILLAAVLIMGSAFAEGNDTFFAQFILAQVRTVWSLEQSFAYHSTNGRGNFIRSVFPLC